MRLNTFMKTRPQNQQVWYYSFQVWLSDNQELKEHTNRGWIKLWNEYCDQRDRGLSSPLNLTPEKRQ